MKFYATLTRAGYDAIASGRRTLFDVLQQTAPGSTAVELGTCPAVPQNPEDALIEIDVPDSSKPSYAESMLYDLHGRRFRLTADALCHGRVRRLNDEQVMEIAREEIDRCLLPSPTRIRDAIARCPAAQRRKRFGPWLTEAFENENAGPASSQNGSLAAGLKEEGCT